MQPLAMSVEQAAATAGVGRTLVFEEIRKGNLRCRKAGRRTVVTLADLESWLAQLPTRDKPSRARATSSVEAK
jgi:excisionase family DNA binding protein